MKLFAANRETFGPNEPEKFHEMGEPCWAFSWNFCFTLYVHSMYTKGNEQVLESNKWEKENKILWVVFFLF
jgi:hypothetical protein